jgi:hypothetical protein
MPVDFGGGLFERASRDSNESGTLPFAAERMSMIEPESSQGTILRLDYAEVYYSAFCEPQFYEAWSNPTTYLAAEFV